jgi:hypothetical protein
MSLYAKIYKDNSMVIKYKWPHEAYAVQKFKETHPDIPLYISFSAEGQAAEWENQPASKQ